MTKKYKILRDRIFIDYTTGNFVVIFWNYIYTNKKELILSNEKGINNFLLNNPQYKDLNHYNIEDLLEWLKQWLDRYNIIEENVFFREWRLVCVRHWSSIGIWIITKIKKIAEWFEFQKIKYIDVITEYGEKLMLNKEQIEEKISRITWLDDIIIDSIIEILNYYNLDEIELNLEDFLI